MARYDTHRLFQPALYLLYCTNLIYYQKFKGYFMDYTGALTSELSCLASFNDLQSTKMYFQLANGKPIFSISKDGTITFDEGFTTTDQASRAFMELVQVYLKQDYATRETLTKAIASFAAGEITLEQLQDIAKV